MKTFFHPISERELTAWIMISVLVAMILAFAYLFWRRISAEAPQSLHPVTHVQVLTSHFK